MTTLVFCSQREKLDCRRSAFACAFAEKDSSCTYTFLNFSERRKLDFVVRESLNLLKYDHALSREHSSANRSRYKC